jgi:hypothetical protein
MVKSTILRTDPLLDLLALLRAGFNNLKQTDVKALAVVTPALLSPDFFKEAAAIVNAGGPPDVNKLNVVMAKHGLVAVM